MNVKSNVEFVVCPDCRGQVESLIGDEIIIGLACAACQLVFPVQDEVFILLPHSARNYDLEYSLVSGLLEQVNHEQAVRWKVSQENTLVLLSARRGRRSWEWEDEEFWNVTYSKQADHQVSKNWNDRIWEREPFVNRLLSEAGNLDGRVILDVGCGEGQNFGHFFAPHCHASTT